MKRLVARMAAIALMATTCFGFTDTSSAQYSDNFDSYLSGTDVHGTNGWKGWDNTPAASALVTNTFSSSPDNSLAIAPTSDLINELGNPTSGAWEVTVDQYIPTGHTGDTYFIMQNTYADGGPYNWSVELLFAGNPAGGGGGIADTVTDDFDPAFAGMPILFDQWVTLRFVIDLDNDTCDQYYNGVEISSGQSWAERSANGGGAGGGVMEIGAVDLFSNGGSEVYYDNFDLQPFVAEPEVIVPATLTVTRGTLNTGGAAELGASDNTDLSIFRASSDVLSRTEFEVDAISPTETPTVFDITLEGSVFARNTVNQSIDLWDFVAMDWEEIDVRESMRFSDSNVEVTPTGDLSRFVEAGVGTIRARVRFRSPINRQRFTSNTDLFSWTVQ